MRLFVYGTLMDEEYTKQFIGRKPIMESARVNNFIRIGLNIVEKPQYQVEGKVFEVNEEDMEIFDKYEGVNVGLYKRIKVQLEDGEAIAYQKVNSNYKIYVSGMKG